MPGVWETVWGADADRQRFPAACGRLYREESQHGLTAYCLRLTATLMFRKTLTILSLIGLLLSVGLWGVSYWMIGLFWPPKIGLVATDGSAELRLFGEAEYNSEALLLELHAMGIDARSFDGPAISCWGFNGWRTSFWYFSCKRFRSGFLMACPLWLPCLLFLAMSWFCVKPLHIHRRRKRKKLGLCVKCGYDLRGSKSRCPECGQEFETP